VRVLEERRCVAERRYVGVAEIVLPVELSATVHSGGGGETDIPSPYVEEHARYRWMIGHHVSFCLWLAQGWLLRSIVLDRRPSSDQVAAAARLFDLYSLMLLYAGSCTREYYEAVIRPDMRAWHPAFSGEWSRDYPVVAALLHDIRAQHQESVSQPLVAASQRNHRVHLAVARKLVPGGYSLLKEAGRRPVKGGTSVENDLFDAYFRVRRASVCHCVFVGQAVTRLERISQDIHEFGLHPEPPAPLIPEDGPELVRLEQDAAESLSWLAGLLTHLTPERGLAE
jgi:hypothetical protein